MENRNTFSERCLHDLNFQIKSRKIPTLLWIYTEGKGDLRDTKDERSRKTRRAGDRLVDKWQRSQDGGGWLRPNREAAYWVTGTKRGAESPYEKELLIWVHCCRGSIHQGQEGMVGQHKPHVTGQEAKQEERHTGAHASLFPDTDAV